MTTIQDIAQTIEQKAPLSLQEDYDNSGLQVGDLQKPVTKVLITLDVTEESLAEAKEIGAQLVVSHHPLLFRGLKKVTPTDYIGRTVIEAVKSDIAIYSAHTNLDNAPGGVNYKIAEVMGLRNLHILMPLPTERTASLPTDMASLCGSGIVGELAQAMSEEAFVADFKKRFNCPYIKHNATGRTIRKVALCGGAGGFLIGKAMRSGADAYITGEIGYHPFIGNTDILLMEAGHYETEQYTCQLLAQIIGEVHPEVECVIAQKTFHTYVTK